LGDTINRQRNIYYDDDRCKESKEYRFQQNRTNFFLDYFRRNNTNDESIQNINHNANKLQIKRTPKTSSHLQENDSLSAMLHKNDPISDQYKKPDDETDFLIQAIMPTPIPQNSSLVRIK